MSSTRCRSAFAACLIPLVLHGTAARTQSPDPILGDFHFRSIGPAAMSGRVDDIVASERLPATFYVGFATGGVWKTVTNGTTWMPIFDGSVGDFAISQKNPETVWVGTGEANNRQSSSFGDGIYKSTDGGRTFRHMGLRDTQTIAHIVLDPRDDNVVYVAAPGHLFGPNPDGGVYKTVNGGDTWTKVKFVDEHTGFTDLVLDTQNPDIIIAASHQRRRTAWGYNGGGPGSGIWRSTDAGATWTKLERNQIDLLPTVSRDFRAFLRLVPGTTSTTEGAAFLGARARSNNWQIDGVDNNSDSAGFQNITPQLDSIAEFQVQTANFKAEFGRAAGGVVNAVTRSGTNTFHGSAFTYYRDEGMRARSPFEDRSVPKAPFQRMYNGGTVGGPIARNRNYFFFSFERNDQDQNSDTTYDLPPSTSPFSAATLQFLSQNGLSPAIFGAGGRQFFIRASPLVTNKATVRIDHDLNSRHILTGRYSFDGSSRAIGDQEDLFDLNADHNDTRNHLVNVNHKWIVSSRALNEAYVQYNPYWFDTENNVPNMPFTSVPGFSMGGSTNNPQGDDGYRLHLKDNFSWTLGTHQFKTGGELRFYRSEAFVRINFAGTYTFPTVASFIAGTPSRYTITIGNPDVPLSSNIVGTFFQDDWKVTNSLTLNLGVRYDYTASKVPELAPGVVVDLGPFLPLKGGEDPAISRDKNNVAPRFGFIWSPDSKQAIYGGTGIYYDQVILNNYVSTMFGPPRRTSVTIDNPLFPYPPSLLPTTPGTATSANYFDENFSTPYNWNTTIGYRRELLADLGLDIALLHNRGEEQQMQVQANPGRLGTASITGAGAIREVPTVGSVNRYFSGGVIRYTGLQIELRKRMSHNIQGGIAYTLSYGDDNSFNMISNVQDPRQPQLSYGPSNNDVRNRIVGHAELMLPWDIQMGTIIEFRTNSPLNITAGARDLNGDGITGDWVNEIECINIACQGFRYSRNSVRQLSTEEANRLRALFALAPIATFENNPNYTNVDLTLRKNVRFGRHQFSVFVDSFNLFNTKQYGQPTQNITSNLFGSRTSVAQMRIFQVGGQYRF